MHLEGPWLSTTSTKKRKETLTKAKQNELERQWRERNVRLKQMHLPKETFEQFLDWVYGRSKKTSSEKTNKSQSSTPIATRSNEISKKSKSVHHNNIVDPAHSPQPKSLSSWITGPVSSKPSPIYTGSKVLGISQMAKSNAIPVFNQNEIIDVARMRR